MKNTHVIIRTHLTKRNCRRRTNAHVRPARHAGHRQRGIRAPIAPDTLGTLHHSQRVTSGTTPELVRLIQTQTNVGVAQRVKHVINSAATTKLQSYRRKNTAGVRTSRTLGTGRTVALVTRRTGQTRTARHVLRRSTHRRCTVALETRRTRQTRTTRHILRRRTRRRLGPLDLTINTNIASRTKRKRKKQQQQHFSLQLRGIYTQSRPTK